MRLYISVSLRDVLLATSDWRKNEVNSLKNTLENRYNLGESDESPFKKISWKLVQRDACERNNDEWLSSIWDYNPLTF